MLDHTLTFFQAQPWTFNTSVLILGLLVGSFLNVVIYRLPIMMQREWRGDCLEFLEQTEETETEKYNLVVPRSRCSKCGHQITALENIPLLSYLFLGGKCSSCKTHISLQYPLVELFTGLISLWIAVHFGLSLQTVFALVLSWSLIAASGIDISHKLLPDNITLPLLWLGILLGYFNVFVDLETSVIGAMAGYLSLWSVYIVFKIITGKEGMGYGDFKLLAMLGAWMGWKMLFVIILTSSLVGAIVGISMIVLKKTERGTQIPFGPYLAAAGWLSLLYGEQLNHFYFSFL
ncbi:MAG: A24 family peptidase [Gammaproteobacteria bacterium]|nr:A24 family peptidase [Gammaproteobacteria bacterium]